PYPETKASEQDEAEEAGCGLVVPGGNTPLFLELTNEAFNASTQPVEQGCSTLLTEAPLGQSIKPRQSGGVSVLTEGADFIPAQPVVSEAAQPGEDTGVVTYAGLIFLKGDIAGVVQRVLDVPVVSNRDGRGACRDAEIGHIICNLGCAGPQTI